MIETELERLKTIAKNEYTVAVNAVQESPYSPDAYVAMSHAYTNYYFASKAYAEAVAARNYKKAYGDDDQPLKMLMLFSARLTVSKLIEHLKGYSDDVTIESYGKTGTIGDHIVVEYDDRAKKVTISNEGTELTKELSK